MSGLPEYIPLLVIVCVLSIMMVTIIVANVLLIVTLTTRKRVRTVTNAYIVSLSAADLMVGLLVTLTILTHVGVPLGKEWCIFASYIEIATFAAGILSLLAITIDRFRCVIRSTIYKPSLEHALKTIAFVWATSLFYGCRVFLQLAVSGEGKVKTDMNNALKQTSEEMFCIFFVENDSQNAYFRLVDFICLFILPIIAIAFMNAKIIIKLKNKPSPVLSPINRKKRVIQMLIACVIAFFVCWCPFYVQEIIHDFDSGTAIETERTYVIVRFVSLVLALFNSVFNAIIYGYFNQNFRKELTLFWTHFKTISRRNLVTDSEVIQTRTS